MSSNLTSVSINKNKSRFAPKVKSRPTKRPQTSDAPTSSSSSTTKSSLPLVDTSDTTTIATAVTALANSSTQPDNMEDTIRQLSSSTIPSVANAVELLTKSGSPVKALMQLAQRRNQLQHHLHRYGVLPGHQLLQVRLLSPVYPLQPPPPSMNQSMKPNNRLLSPKLKLPIHLVPLSRAILATRRMITTIEQPPHLVETSQLQPA
ncbi:unnamed protein product [Absidia cylindrospora]